jgi:hypothetical protein
MSGIRAAFASWRGPWLVASLAGWIALVTALHLYANRQGPPPGARAVRAVEVGGLPVT